MELKAKVENGLAVVSDYDVLVETVDKGVEKASEITSINNDIDLANAKATRTVIRKSNDLIATLRKDTIKKYMQVFESQCKTLEKKLKDSDARLKVLVDDYVAKEEAKKEAEVIHEDPTQVFYKITIISTNPNDCEDILAMCKSRGINATFEEITEEVK